MIKPAEDVAFFDRTKVDHGFALCKSWTVLDVDPALVRPTPSSLATGGHTLRQMNERWPLWTKQSWASDSFESAAETAVQPGCGGNSMGRGSAAAGLGRSQEQIPIDMVRPSTRVRVNA